MLRLPYLKIDLDNPWLISDTHFGHKNIVEYEGRPSNHEHLMIQNWHKHIKPEDIVIHLGDVIMGSGWREIFRNLPGQKILVRGNHDADKTGKLRSMGFSVCVEELFITNPLGLTFHCTHRPILDPDKINGCMNLHGHIHSGLHRPDETPPAGRPEWRSLCVETNDYSPVKLTTIEQESQSWLLNYL